MVFWLALAAWIVLTLAGVAFAAVRGIALWRATKRSGGAITERLDEISRGVEQIEAHLARAEESGVRLRAANARLAESRARVDVLLGAVREARALIDAAIPLVGLSRR